MLFRFRECSMSQYAMMKSTSTGIADNYYYFSGWADDCDYLPITSKQSRHRSILARVKNACELNPV